MNTYFCFSLDRIRDLLKLLNSFASLIDWAMKLQMRNPTVASQPRFNFTTKINESPKDKTTHWIRVSVSRFRGLVWISRILVRFPVHWRVSVAQVLMAAAVLLPSSALSTTKSTDETSTATQRFPRKWIARLFYETLVDFAVAEGLGSSVCQMHTQMYRKNLANDTNWAVQSEYTTIGIALWKRL